MDATKLVEEYRHYIQHLRGELARPGAGKSPAWGSLSWVDPEDATLCHTALFGARVDGTEFTSAVFDRAKGTWASRVCLGVNGKSFNFDLFAEEARRFESLLLSWLKAHEGKGLKISSEIQIMSLRFVVGQPPNHSAETEKSME